MKGECEERGKKEDYSRRQSLECGAEVTAIFKRFPKAKASNTELRGFPKSHVKFNLAGFKK